MTQNIYLSAKQLVKTDTNSLFSYMGILMESFQLRSIK